MTEVERIEGVIQKELRNRKSCSIDEVDNGFIITYDINTPGMTSVGLPRKYNISIAKDVKELAVIVAKYFQHG